MSVRNTTSRGNSTKKPLAAGETFLGEGEDVDLYEQTEIYIRFAGDEGSGLEGYKLPQVAGEPEIMMESGRGLHLVRKHADEIYFNNSGNAIWALFSKTADGTNKAAPHMKCPRGFR